jgi:predicted nucleic acid-binding protein
MIVSNSSPLMNLAIIGHLHLLKELFGKIVVTDQVWKELTVDGRGKPGAKAIEECDWIVIETIQTESLFRLLCKDLDVGEASVIALAVEKEADLILLDETDARNMAEIYNLRKTGLLGILMRAKQAKLIKEVKPLLSRLQIEANFWISSDLFHEILERTNEI